MGRNASRLAGVLTVLIPMAAAADTVLLKNQGKIFNCRILAEEPGGQVFLRTLGGRMGVPRSEIVRIEKQKSVFDAYDEMLAKLGPKDMAAHMKLALWCRSEAGMWEEADELAKKVMAMKSDHPQARRMLGYVRDAGEWHLPPPLSVRCSITADKLLEEEVTKQLGILLPTRKDLQVVPDLKDLKSLNGLELAINVEMNARDRLTFYGQQTQEPTTVATITLTAASAWTGKTPPKLVLEGALLTAIPDARRLAVGDAFTRHPLEVHAFLDNLIKERLAKIEALLARRNEEKKAQASPEKKSPASPKAAPAAAPSAKK
jgi:hypothetical protein